MMKVIAPVLGGIYQSMPGVKIVVSPLSETSEKALADGTLDLIVTGFDPDRSAVHGEKLFEERRLCLARPDHPLFEQQPINLDRFLAYPHAAVTVAGNCADTIEDALPPGRHRQLILRTPVFSVAPHLAASSDVVITLPASAAELYAEQHGLRVFEPPLNLGAFNYWLCWHERSQRDPSTLWLVDQLSAPFRASNGRKAAPDRTSIEVEAA
jgi:DNA-binding transcriptional LysR family regulator